MVSIYSHFKITVDWITLKVFVRSLVFCKLKFEWEAVVPKLGFFDFSKYLHSRLCKLCEHILVLFFFRQKMSPAPQLLTI